MFRNKSAYPIYLTIGNIPKEIRRKPSCRAYVLLGYLPTSRLEHITNKASRRRVLANLYHAAVKRILLPLEHLGIVGINMATGTGEVHRNHPIFACFVGDYPEQIQATGAITMECPECPEHRDHMGDTPTGKTSYRNLEAVLKALSSFDNDPGGFLRACKDAHVKPIIDPFWKDLPYVNIFQSITPDVLHQLYQGILKHIISWLIQVFGAAEIDARCRRLPPSHSIRLFMKGISHLSRVTGQEHDQISRFILGIVVGIPLPGGISAAPLICSLRAILDFLYLAQYPIHTDDTLQQMDDALIRFHENKHIFVTLGIRQHFNIPKLHFARHYVRKIKLFGTTDNVNTEYTERLHIDLAKDAYRATNRRDEYPQMVLWLERREKVQRHAKYIEWRVLGCPPIQCRNRSPPGLQLDRELRIAKHPTIRSVSFQQLVDDYGATFFMAALARFVSLTNNPNIRRAQLENDLLNTFFSFSKVQVWHRAKFVREDSVTGVWSTVDSVHVQPSRSNKHGNQIPSRFDTVLVNDGTGQVTGVEGIFIVLSQVISINIPDKVIALLEYEPYFHSHLELYNKHFAHTFSHSFRKCSHMSNGIHHSPVHAPTISCSKYHQVKFLGGS